VKRKAFAISLVVIASLLGPLACVSAQSIEPNLKVTYISTRGAGNAKSALIYTTRNHKSTSVSMDYWPLINRYLGPSRDKSISMGLIHNVHVDSRDFDQPVINQLIKQFGVGGIDTSDVRPWNLNQAQRLVEIRTSLRFTEYDSLPLGSNGFKVRGMASKSACDLILIYDERHDNLIFVDSVDMHAQEQDGGDWGYRDAAFDQSGSHFYFEKVLAGQEHAYAYDLTTSKLEEIKGYATAIAPWNSNRVLVYSDKERSLNLVGAGREVEKKLRAELPFGVFSCYQLDSLRYVVGSRERPYSGGSAYMKVSLANFSSGTFTELFSTDDPGFILGVEIDTVK
jgi:hypothetical protein